MPGAILGTRSKSAGIRSLQCEVSKNFTLPLDQNLGGGGATAAPACTTITTIGAWEALGVGGCDIGDKNWAASGDVNLADATQVLFSFIGDVYAMQIIGFDNSTAAASWAIDYTITVLASPNFISDMFAGADNPGGGSLLQKDVTPNSNPAFSLFVVNGVENAASEKHGLNSTSATVHEAFSVNANATLLSVSDTFVQGQQRVVPEPASLLLLATGLVGMGWFSRRRGNRA